MNLENFKYPSVIKKFEIGQKTYQLEVIPDLDQAVDLLCGAMEPQDQMSVFAEDLCPYFGVLWDAGLALSHFIENYHDRFKGKSVLEIGAGVGLPSIVALHHGADVLTTDYHPQAGSYFQKNLDLNQLQGKYQRLNWREEDLDHKFDIVIGSDILYEGKHMNEVSNGLVRFLKPQGEIYLSDPGRAYLQGFLKAMERFELKQEKHIISLKDKDYFLYRFYDYLRY